MSNEPPATNQTSAKSGSAPRSSGAGGADHCIVKRQDGVFIDPSVLGTMFQNAVNNLFSSNAYFSGLDYPVFIKALYDHGPDIPRSRTGEVLIRFAADIVPFKQERRALYKAVKINQGKAEYLFEPVYLADPSGIDSEGTLTYLDFDEFVADMWTKGVRFGIEATSVRTAIECGKVERVLVAQKLEPTPGVDAHIDEVSQDIHRSNAPRMLASGKLDLMEFQNRFPQIKKGVRLLKKVPRKDGVNGRDISGILIEPPMSKDVNLGQLAGPGTVIDVGADGEFLVALQAGFLNVDAKSHQLSVGDKIVSRDGVSSRTTGNLHLSGDYEEFGEVQEKRLIEGDSITLHADVFGNIVSRGGTIIIGENLMGGSAQNANGDIRIKGVASASTVQTKSGVVAMNRAESCIISGTQVVIEHATNCEIMADEVIIKHAEGCSIAARKIEIERAGPRKQIEMQLFVLVPDKGKLDRQIEELGAKVEEFSVSMAKRQREIDTLANQPEVRSYLKIANRVHKKELVLTAEQIPQFQKMVVTAEAPLKAISKMSHDLKSLTAYQQTARDLAAKLIEKRSAIIGGGHVSVQEIDGETIVRTLNFDPDGGSVYDVPAKDIKARLRGVGVGGDQIFSGQSGTVHWELEQH